MAHYRIKAPKTRPVDSRDRLPSSGEALVFLPTGHWVKLTARDLRNLKRFSSNPFYWAPLGAS